MSEPNITAPTADLSTLVRNHEQIMEHENPSINESPGALAHLDQLVAETTTELAEFGVDTSDPTVARTVLALAHVMEARATRYVDELECEHFDCFIYTINEAMTDCLLGVTESAARRAS